MRDRSETPQNAGFFDMLLHRPHMDAKQVVLSEN